MSTATQPLTFASDPLDELEPPALAPPPPPVRRRRRWPILIGLAVLAAGAGTALWRGTRSEPAPSYETVRVDRGRITLQVTASGTVSALKTVQVGSEVSGRVAEIHADFNDVVKKGQLLARLDPQLFVAAIEQARANLALARANVAKAAAQLGEAERAYTRGKALGEAKVLAEEVVDGARVAVEVARAQVAGARAQAQQATASLRQAELNLARTAIHSPIDGVVISRAVDVGQTVAASLQAPTVFTLAEDLRKMQVEAHVAEGDVAKLTPGMPVSFTVDAFAGRKFAGTLRQVRNAAETVQNVVTYDAIVDVENPTLELRPGMTANVTFVVADKRDVLRIPNAALRLRPSPEALAKLGAERAARTDGRVVYALDQQSDKPTARPTRVRLGITDGSHTELVEGALAEGTELLSDLGDGAPRAAAGNPRGPMGALSPVGAPGMGRGRR